MREAYGPPDPLADYRAIPVQTLVCKAPAEPVPRPHIETVVAASVFIIAAIMVAMVVVPGAAKLLVAAEQWWRGRAVE